MPKVRDLRLIDELPARIAEPLMWFENIFKHGQPAYLLALLTGLSVCHHTKTRFSVSPTHWFSVPLNLYSGIVGQVSTGKTPLVDTVVRKPLHALEKLEPDPKAHHARRYFFQDATNAWLRDQFLTLPNQSLLYFRDGGLPRILIPPRFGYSQSPSARHPDLLLGYDGEAVLETGLGYYTPQYK